MRRDLVLVKPTPVARETEFLPAALEVTETPASPLGRAIAGVIILFFIIALAWAWFGKVDIIAVAQGKIIPSGRTKIIQPFETGVVRAIHVRDGQHVQAGDVLIEIDATINQAERDRLQQDWLQAKLDAARLKAAMNIKSDPLTSFKAPEGASDDQVKLQQRLLATQVEEIRAKLQGFDQKIAEGDGNRNAVEQTIAKLNETIPLLKKRFEMRQELADKGYGSKLNALEVQQDLVASQNELLVQKGRLAEATATVAGYKEQRRQAEAEFRRGTLDDLSTAENKAAALHEQLVQATRKYNLQTLTAPVEGTVQQLAVHTEGGVVTPAQALLAIVPAGSQLEIEANVSNRDIGFVYPGQQVAVKVDTFNFTKYGLLSGTVESVSQDAVPRAKAIDSRDKPSGTENESSEPDGQALVYLARIRLEQTSMDIDGKQVNLAPGMAISAEIKTGQRRLIEYILSPLARHSQQAMRER